MTSIAVKDLKRPRELRDTLEREREVMVTKDGKPFAIMIGVEPDGADDALRDYDPGGKSAPAVVGLARLQAARPPKTPLETQEQLEAIGGILLDVQGLPAQVTANALFEVDLALFNLSRSQIPLKFLSRPVSLSYHILDGAKKRVIWNGLRTALPEPVEYQCFTPLQIEAPQAPGSYLLQAALVVEGQRWFNSHQLWPFEVV